MDIEENIVNNFFSDDEVEDDIIREPLSIRKQDFENNKIISLLQSNNIIKKEIICSKCYKKMNLVNSNETVDKKIWRCRGNSPIHDIKIGLRSGSIYENIRVPLNTIYYLTFFCFLKNLSIRRTKNEINNFCNIMGQSTPNEKTIIKIFRKLRNKIKIYHHKIWNQNLLGSEPEEDGKPRVEIDETELIGNSEKILWLFGIIDRSTKEARVFSVMDNRRKENLIPLVVKNVHTETNSVFGIDFRTRVYSDCFSVYREQDFEGLGYLLHRVNHSIWFGRGLFHTNTIEGLWSCLKRLSKNFTGINFNTLKNIEKEGLSQSNYIDDWVCFYLFLRDIERKNYSDDEGKNI